MSIATDWLRLRLAVSYLGEKAQKNWWPTSFYESSSRPFLEPTFPRSSYLAQYQGACASARQVHDAHIGIGNAFHLFRLPAELEQDLFNAFRGMDAIEISTATQSFDAAREVLVAFVEGGGAVMLGEGPVMISPWPNRPTRTTIAGLAQAYHYALENNIEVFPYLVS
jgi:hypothetical protein